MSEFTLNINGVARVVNYEEGKPLLWILRDDLGLKGSKFGCGIGMCGACTVLVNNKAMRSCQLTLSQELADSKITTIEGVEKDEFHAVQMAWKALDVPQCGYCQSGQILSAISLLEKNKNPSKQQIRTAMNGNICRCATYLSIEKAVEHAANLMNS